jgi:hypothetical protein
MSHNSNWDVYALEEFERDYEGYDDFYKGSHRSSSVMAETAAEMVYREFSSEEDPSEEECWEDYDLEALSELHTFTKKYNHRYRKIHTDTTPIMMLNIEHVS